MFKPKDRSPLNNAGQQMVAPRESTTEEKKRVTIEFQQKIEDLLSEIKQKDATIRSLQNNYEGISLIYKEEKTKSLEWEDKIQAIERDNAALKVKLQTVENQKAKLAKDYEKNQEELGKFVKINNEYKVCKIENQSNKVLLEKKKKEVEEMSRKLEISKGEADALKKVKLDLSANLKKAQSELDVLNKEKPELLDEIDRLKYECDTLQLTLNKKVLDLEECSKELNTIKAREHKYYTELASLKTNFDVEKNELYATRGKLMELYEHYKLLESQIETKNALLQLADSTEKELKLKLKLVENTLLEKQQSLNEWSTSKNEIKKALKASEETVEKLMRENEALEEGQEVLKTHSSGFMYLIEELVKLVRWYDTESSKLGKQNTFPAVSGSIHEKMEKVLHQLSTVLTESLLIMKHYEELNVKYNAAVSQSQNVPKSGLAEYEELGRLNDLIKLKDSHIEDLKKSRQQVYTELDAVKLDKERTKVELDTARQKILMLEKEVKLKTAMIEQYEERFTGAPDQLLSRIEQLKNELEQFNVGKEDTEAKKVLERVKNGLQAIWTSLTCKGCLEAISKGFVRIECGHVSCENCRDKEDCIECGKKNSTVELPLVEQVTSKLTYLKQALNDLSLNLA